ncbi:hypothetical protein C923_01192 [Plasmodium falciparum UGT5.1]|uniref:Uncharacterized protein n=3 Tax=Plasmodium falciparum TaxID=5833 RepID=A0A024WBD3_PLAFA|nr:hypothetical protein PFTANZ_01172 [Plasmodium falciparum Tanzania (2000708)]ETW50805.1 hypothetical protein PFMALIP_01162 [Plasmodium falciparum MaliPS096_E11]EWC78126.1 hypothetical protein C923_01192 [Plasmodium falciparum UGT5.1]
MHKIIHINNKTYKKITKVYLTILFKKNNNKISFSIIKYVLYIKLNKCMDFHYNVEDYKLKTKKNKIKQKIKQKK